MVKRVLSYLVALALLSWCAPPAYTQGLIDWGGHPSELQGRLENGELSGIRYFRLVGLNDDIDLASDEDVWDLGGDLNFDSSATQLYISSSNGADTMDITIEGLGALGVEQTATETLAGLTFTATADLWLRVFRVTVVGASAPAGDVYVHTDSVDGGSDGIPDTPQTDTRAQVLAGNFLSHSGFYTCPLTKACFVLNPGCSGSVGLTPGIGYLLHRTSAAGPWLRVWQPMSPYMPSPDINTFALKLDALEEMRFRGDAGGDNSVFTASALILIYDAD